MHATASDVADFLSVLLVWWGRDQTRGVKQKM